MNSKQHTQQIKDELKDAMDSDFGTNTIYRVQRYDHYTIYTKNGFKHRVNGPAMTIGDKEWFYINGYLKTPKEHALYKELYNNYDEDAPSTIEDGYYTKASESPTSIYILTPNEVTTSTSV